MPLVTVRDAELAFGLTPLLDRAQLSVRAGERVALIGRNGTGKSSLIDVIAGRRVLDAGEVQRREGLVVVTVEQEPLLAATGTLRDAVAQRAGLAGQHDNDDPARWRIEARLTEYLDRLGVDPARDAATASGGERKRAALACAFALDADLLLLDEPTNHLDLDGIVVLEELIQRARSCLLITHDRWFLDRVATRIVELDRGLLRSYPGNYSAYAGRKQDELAAEATANRKFDRFWAQEEAWIRRGVEARRTRDEGRVRRLEGLRSARAQRRERAGQMGLSVDTGQRSGRLVAELIGVTKAFGGRPIVEGLSLRIMRADRVGLIGPNGAGKSTLLKLILGEIAPDSGTARLGTNLEIAYFDQMREGLELDDTVAENVAPGSEWVEVGGQRRHVLGYLADFLFSPQRAATPVRALSGGERNRLLLARLFARPANVLVLDEPTNDLDMETLDLLEQVLQECEATVLLVSHDRAFVDAVVTQTLVAEGAGRWSEFVGGYSDWLALRRTAARDDRQAQAAHVPPPREAGKRARAKLSFKESRELGLLPAEIEALEAEQAALVNLMATADYHRREADALRSDRERLDDLPRLIESKLARWEELEARSAG